MLNNTNRGSSALVQILYGKIMRGELRKGDRLPTERSLCEEYNISRSTVREALKAMETMGICYSVQGSGTYITKETDSSVNLAICALFALGGGDLRSIMRLRELLETEACRMIIAEAEDEELALIEKASQYDYFAPVSETAQMDSVFHKTIIRLCKDNLISCLYTTLSSLMDIYREQILTATDELQENYITQENHRAICDALLRRDEAAAEKAVKTHLEINEKYANKIQTEHKK